MNFDLLFELVVLLGLAGLLPLLETIHSLIKFVEQKDIFVCNQYIVAIKVCSTKLYGLYNDPMTCFVFDAFKDFKDVLSCKHNTISLRWIASELDINATNVEYLVFQCGENQFYVTHPRPIIGRANKVT